MGKFSIEADVAVTTKTLVEAESETEAREVFEKELMKSGRLEYKINRMAVFTDVKKPDKNN